MKTSAEELKANLIYFTGSEQVYKHNVGNYSILLTEGVKYLCEKAEAYWLADLLLSYQIYPKISQEEFQVWKLVSEGKNSFVITCTDGNKNKLAEQFISFSDFPLEGITLWLVKGICMLPSEY